MEENFKMALRENSIFWMEYEGFGCPEIYNILSRDNKNNYQYIDEYLNISKDINSSIGTTHQALAKYVLQFSKKSLEAGEEVKLYSLLENTIHNTWDEQEKKVSIFLSNNHTNNHNINSKKYYASLYEDIIVDQKLTELVSNGYLSYAIEYYLLEISISTFINHKENKELHTESLMKLLVDAQEYSLCKSLSKRIGKKNMNIVSQSLVNYVQTITTKSSFECFMLMNSLKVVMQYKIPKNRAEEFFFLINNQSAFCKALTGDNKGALNHEIAILKTTSNSFYRYIACINSTRIMLREKDELSILPILAGLKIILKCKYKHAYQFIFYNYLYRWSQLIGSPLSIVTIKPEESKKNPYYGNNWRALQANNSFIDYTNYSLSKIWGNHDINNRRNKQNTSVSRALTFNLNIDDIEQDYMNFLAIVLEKNKSTERFCIQCCSTTVTLKLVSERLQISINVSQNQQFK